MISIIEYFYAQQMARRSSPDAKRAIGMLHSAALLIFPFASVIVTAAQLPGVEKAWVLEPVYRRLAAADLLAVGLSMIVAWLLLDRRSDEIRSRFESIAPPRGPFDSIELIQVLLLLLFAVCRVYQPAAGVAAFALFLVLGNRFVARRVRQ